MYYVANKDNARMRVTADTTATELSRFLTRRHSIENTEVDAENTMIFRAELTLMENEDALAKLDFEFMRHNIDTKTTQFMNQAEALNRIKAEIYRFESKGWAMPGFFPIMETEAE